MSSSLQSAFTAVLNLSITGSVALLAVMALRPALRRAPKALSAALWFAPLLRLLCPVSLPSAMSVFALLGNGGAPQPVPMDIGLMAQPRVDLFVPPISNAVSQALPAATPAFSMNPMQVWLALGAVLWAAGVLVMALWGVFSYIRLKLRLRTATREEGVLWRTDHAGAPFVLGLLRPRIYVPEGLRGEPLDHILRHERAHLRHGDPWVKALWYAALCLHWFNPLVWLAFRLMGRDMELRADEAALRSLGQQERSAYAETLLGLCRPRRALSAPLAFGESGAPGRIRRALNYKRPTFWIVAAAAVAVVTVVVALTTNPFERKNNAAVTTDAGLAQKLYDQRTPYIGDNSKVGAILGLLPYPDGVQLNGFELQTKEQPYGVIARMKADSAYHREDAAQLLQWERSASVLFALVGNADWIRFDVTQGSRSQQYLFDTNATESTNYDIKAIRAGETGVDSLANLIVGSPSMSNSYFDVQQTPALSHSNSGAQIVSGDEDTVLRELFHAYAIAPNTSQKLPQADGYTVTFRYSESLAGGMSLRVLKNGDQVWAQMTDNNGSTVRKLDGKIYPQLEALYTQLIAQLAAQPVVTANATTAPLAQQYDVAKLSYGKEVTTRTDFTSDEQYLMDSVFFDHAIHSAAWPGLDVDTLETCYRIRIYTDPNQPTELYVYQNAGATRAQLGKDGLYTSLSDTLYHKVAAMLFAQLQIDLRHRLPEYRSIGSDETDSALYGLLRDHFVQAGSSDASAVAWRVLGRYRQQDSIKVFCVAGTGTVLEDLAETGEGMVGYEITQAALCVLTLRKTVSDGTVTFSPVENACLFVTPASVDELRKVCTMPVTGEEIQGLAQRMMDIWTGVQKKDGKIAAPLGLLLVYNKQTQDLGKNDEISYLED